MGRGGRSAITGIGENHELSRRTVHGCSGEGREWIAGGGGGEGAERESGVSQGGKKRKLDIWGGKGGSSREGKISDYGGRCSVERRASGGGNRKRAIHGTLGAPLVRVWRKRSPEGRTLTVRKGEAGNKEER